MRAGLWRVPGLVVTATSEVLVVGMRVILALHQFLPEFFSGTEVLTHRVATGLRRRGHEVMVFSATPVTAEIQDDERFEWREFDGIPVLRFAHQHRPMAGETDLLRQEYDSSIVRGRFERLLAEWRPDCVHFFNFSRISTSPAECCSRAGIPFFYTATDFWSVCLTARLQLEDGAPCAGPSASGGNCMAHLLQIKKPKVVRWFAGTPWVLGALARAGGHFPLNRFAATRMLDSLRSRLDVVRGRLMEAKAIWVPTQAMVDVLNFYGIAPANLRKLTYGIDLASATRRLRRRSTGPLKLGFIGTISYHKGLHDLIGALVINPELDVSLAVYGDTGIFPDYYKKIEQPISADARIVLKGSFSPDEVDRVFSEIDVLVVPSLWRENAPLVVLEALARGCPVLAADQEGLAEFVEEGRNGLLFDSCNPESLARSLQKFFSEPGLLERLSAGCSAQIGIDEYLDDIENSYFNVF